jgi:hypothetical protein
MVRRGSTSHTAELYPPASSDAALDAPLSLIRNASVTWMSRYHVKILSKIEKGNNDHLDIYQRPFPSQAFGIAAKTTELA